MNMKLIRRTALAAGLAAMTAVSLSAQKAGSAPKAQQYHVEFAFPNGTYAGTMTVTIAKGTVAGKMAIETPHTITGTVAGTAKGATLALDYPYEIPGDKPCTGRVTVNATFNAARTEAKGTTHADGCGEPVDGQFTMTKSPAASAAAGR
jgi:hypothetical protein